MAFLREAYVQPDLDAFAHHTVDQLSRVIGGHRFSYNEVDQRLGTIRAVTRPSGDVPNLSARHYREHPMLQRYIETGDGRAYKFSDFLTVPQLEETEMYQEHYRLAGVVHQMTICLTLNPHPLGFAVSRDRLDFSERDRAALDLLRPHLSRAYEQASAAGRFRARLALLGRAAEAADAGVVLLARDGRIEFSTRRARAWLREYFPRRGRPSATRLPAAVAEWAGRQGAWAASGDLLAPPPPLVVAREGRRLVIRAVADRAVLLEERREAGLPAGLAPLGLTSRANEVLALVARGASNEAISRALGARPRTVAKHVERIHRKLGVDRRAGAAARAHEAWGAAARPVE
jgi:DNA-binding NarL/FixJ family response regulator